MQPHGIADREGGQPRSRELSPSTRGVGKSASGRPSRRSRMPQLLSSLRDSVSVAMNSRPPYVLMDADATLPTYVSTSAFRPRSCRRLRSCRCPRGGPRAWLGSGTRSRINCPSPDPRRHRRQPESRPPTSGRPAASKSATSQAARPPATPVSTATQRSRPHPPVGLRHDRFGSLDVDEIVHPSSSKSATRVATGPALDSWAPFKNAPSRR